MDVPYMVKQTITYSDGTETVINYRGKIVNGEVIVDNVPEEVKEEVSEEPTLVEEVEPSEEE